MTEVRVRAMTPPEFATWRRAVDESYALAQVEAGVWAADEAVELARTGNDALMPDGQDTDGMLFLTGTRPDGTPVGVAWLGLTHPRGAPGCAFLYDFEIFEAHRGVGYGRALLALAERTARDRGATGLELNVFGDNEPAIRLYETAGYTVVTQQMRKPLS
ncbi:GNAT family N-acetyltransferase [Mangrovihabitans endophyticus]|uniref:Putative N-acetyltransferase YycN n=1 Tax=Mangrovihabitans endophyticus TaxID=1751298 RepID=A0A8J3FRL1_9ACTN|nr:GNAT family N-acetyltransferase [Mangrovihabitans endophyticus]GGL07921.1 putative N-acetyltransferase YycN [Mangrovihabitans endophyticus]